MKQEIPRVMYLILELWKLVRLKMHWIERGWLEAGIGRKNVSIEEVVILRA